MVAEGATWPRRLGWRYRAITFGHIVLCVDEVDDRLLDHEMVHVTQYERWGPFFVPAYLVASLWANLRGGRGYADNRFEVAARSSRRSAPDGEPLERRLTCQVPDKIPKTSGVTVTTVTRAPTTVGEQEGRDGPRGG